MEGFADSYRLPLAIIVTLVITLLWIHGSSQSKVNRSVRSSMIVALKLILVHLLWYGLLCGLFPATTPTYLIATGILFAFCSTPVGADCVSAGTDFVDVFVTLVALLPFVIRQFVLGFPERDRLIPQPEPQPAEEPVPPPRQSDIGTTITPLRPSGRIEIAGEEFDAISQSGTMIDAGTSVQITGHRRTSYLVTVADPPNT